MEETNVASKPAGHLGQKYFSGSVAVCKRDFVGFGDESARTVTSRIRVKVFRVYVELELLCLPNIVCLSRCLRQEKPNSIVAEFKLNSNRDFFAF